MAVTSVRARVRMHATEDLPGGELLVHALPELSDGAHAPVCLDRLFARERHIAATSEQLQKYYEPPRSSTY